MTKRLLSILFFFTLVLATKAQRNLATELLPVANETFWSTLIPSQMRNSYALLGEKYIGRPWTSIPDSIFSEFNRNGNRSNYETRSNNLRRQMACLVMAEIMEHNGRFIHDIVSGLHFFSSEIWWGVPAHYPTNKPNASKQVVDLFNAETAGLLAWSIYMLHDELEKQEQGITNQIKREIQRRFLTPALTTDYDWKRRTSNWNPWICSNWLTCALLCEDDKNRQTDAISQILICLDTFIDGNPDDGGCDEGVSYWDRAAGSLMESLILLDIATNGKDTLFRNPKIQALGAFIGKMYIGKGKFVNFADSHERVQPHINILFLTGWYLNDDILLSYATQIAKEKNFNHQPSALFIESGNYPTLGRELLFLSHYQDFINREATEPYNLSVWLPDLQVCTAHSNDKTSSGLFFAAKGGHNGENHNHNDVGNFIVYKDAEPLLIDLGVGTYTAQTFSDKRYELFNCRSAYHNVPLINGVEQHEGKQYHSKSIKYSNKKKNATLSLDIAEAYPKEACVDKWQRTIRLNRGKEVVVTENYKLSQYRQPSEIVLVCCGEVHLHGNDEIVISNGKNQGTLYFDNNQLTPQIEKIDYNDPTIQNSWQKRKLYRIRLTVNSQSTKGKITYFVK